MRGADACRVSRARLLYHAIALTAAVFAAFSASALINTSRTYLYLGGMLFSGLSLLLYASIFRLLFGLNLFSFELYVGLALFCGYVLFDTQVIVEMARLGSSDHIGHAFQLFTDFIAIFVRILIIIMRERERK